MGPRQKNLAGEERTEMVRKVVRLRALGLSNSDLASRLGVGKAMLDGLIREARETGIMSGTGRNKRVPRKVPSEGAGNRGV